MLCVQARTCAGACVKATLGFPVMISAVLMHQRLKARDS